MIEKEAVNDELSDDLVTRAWSDFLGGCKYEESREAILGYIHPIAKHMCIKSDWGRKIKMTKQIMQSYFIECFDAKRAKELKKLKEKDNA